MTKLYSQYLSIMSGGNGKKVHETLEKKFSVLFVCHIHSHWLEVNVHYSNPYA